MRQGNDLRASNLQLCRAERLAPQPWEGKPAQFGCPCTLKLWEAGGPRTVTLGNVTFPASQKAVP